MALQNYYDPPPPKKKNHMISSKILHTPSQAINNDPSTWLDGIKELCEQTRELTDDLHDFLDYV